LQQSPEFGIRHEPEIEECQQPAAALQKTRDCKGLGRQEHRAGTGENEQLACRRHQRVGGQRQLADFVALRLHRAAKAADAMAGGHHDGRRGVVVTVV
jgi:hypothetical protein